MAPRQVNIYGGAWQAGLGSAPSDDPSAPQGPGGPALSGAALATQRLAAWRTNLRAVARARTGMPGEMRALGEQFERWFIPDAPSVLERRDSPEQARSHLPAHDPNGDGIELERLIEQARSSLHPEEKDTYVVGHDMGDHVVAQLHTIVQIDHDPQGRPITSNVLVSSGARAFDARVNDAVHDALQSQQWQPVVDVHRSLWQFTGQVLRWSRKELLLDPQFKPPGREIESESTAFHVSTLVGNVRLLQLLGDPS